jgi:hypothetical protein
MSPLDTVEGVEKSILMAGFLVTEKTVGHIPPLPLFMVK